MMFTPWRSALTYAAWVTVVSWLIGTVVLAGYSLAFGDRLGPTGPEPLTWCRDQAVFLVVCTTVLALGRRLLSPLPRWRTVIVDGILYMLVLGIANAAPYGAVNPGQLLDAAALYSFSGLFTLQLPAAWCVSAVRSGKLDAVLKKRYTLDGNERATPNM
ncbi:hypothetical protein JG491_19085 [Streptomyces sp. CRPSP2-6A1]|uniref:hypothetical protein n=1 Tax=Streptomyces sp. CRPSP2-6A1 TaxID=2799588 RepID=UPI0018F0B5CC|nr:hypothetical protein [Streptomyces sp. CRPSP2-6A1]MBJ7002142.1 hypothetical protein [Streptomyces sp. CRPSP2-6A1]